MIDPIEKQYTSISLTKRKPKGNKPALALLPNRSQEDEINDDGETRDRDGNFNLRRSNRTFKPPERLSSIPFF